MAEAITRLFDRHEDAAAAVSQLEAAGVPREDISLIANNAEGRHLAGGRRDGIDDGDNDTAEGAGKGATTGGLIGGGAGLLAGLGMLAIPGLGPVVAAGWLASTAVGAAIGAAAGGAAGGLLGALKEAGHTDDEAHVYAEGVRRGGTLVSVKLSHDADRATAERVLNGAGVDAATRGADYREAGWKSFEGSAEPYGAEEIAAERRLRFPEDRSFMAQGSQNQSAGQSEDLRNEPVRDGGLSDPANPPPRGV